MTDEDVTEADYADRMMNAGKTNIFPSPYTLLTPSIIPCILTPAEQSAFTPSQMKALSI